MHQYVLNFVLYLLLCVCSLDDQCDYVCLYDNYYMTHKIVMTSGLPNHRVRLTKHEL